MNCATVGIYKTRVEELLKQHAYAGIPSSKYRKMKITVRDLSSLYRLSLLKS